jgi:hypothetical protein
MNLYIAEVYEKQFYKDNPKNMRIYNLLKRDIMNNGTRVYLEGKEIYTKAYKFATDGDCMWDDSFDKPVEEIDFAQLKEDELWAYIYGEYILNGRISGLRGFGCTQTETY